MPADHEWFSEITTAQWHWYLQNIVEDQEEDFTIQRNLLEYHASFLEPELVDKTRKRRDEREDNKKKDDNFSSTIKSIFGRDIAFKGKATTESSVSEVHEVGDILSKIDAYDRAQQKIKSDSVYNFAEWVNFDLE